MQFLHTNTLSVIALLSLLAQSSHALGINCRGSGFCPTGDKLVAENLRNSINGAPDDKVFKKGDHIACDPEAGGTIPYIPFIPRVGGKVCAFVQDIDSMDGRTIKRLAQDIIDQ